MIKEMIDETKAEEAEAALRHMCYAKAVPPSRRFGLGGGS